MNTLPFLAGWAIRSSILILSGALLLKTLRIGGASLRLAVWIALLVGSLAMPAMMITLPSLPVTVMRAQAVHSVAAPGLIEEVAFAQTPAPSGASPRQTTPFDWERAALVAYLAIAFALLLRLAIGLVMSLRLLRGSGPTGRTTEGVGIYESDRVSAPVSLGIVRASIVLPIDWREWDAARLEAVLAHERSHIKRRDPAVQLLSAIHRALLWHSPMSWFLHSRIVRVAEEASDDAALAVTCDPGSYAECLLGFIGRGVYSAGVPMARYGSVERRIHRILNATTLRSRGVTRRSVVAIVAMASPLAYVLATAQPQSAPVPRALVQAASASAPPVARPAPRVSAAARTALPTGVLTGLGTVTATTVTVRPTLDGQLVTVGFKEGQLVEAASPIATVEPPGLRAQLDAVDHYLAKYEDQWRGLLATKAPDHEVSAAKAKLDEAQETVGRIERALNEGIVRAPITGVMGLRLIDPGNIVHAGEAIVTMVQMQPISVVFTIPEDRLPQVRTRLHEGNPVVEAWNRDNKVRFATGVLTATDNQIDPETGTVKLKASFDNKDGALFPNQFVNVHLLLNSK